MCDMLLLMFLVSGTRCSQPAQETSSGGPVKLNTSPAKVNHSVQNQESMGVLRSSPELAAHVTSEYISLKYHMTSRNVKSEHLTSRYLTSEYNPLEHVTSQYSASESTQSQHRTSKSTQSQYRTSEPIQSQYRSSKPIQSQLRTSEPIQSQYKTTQPIQSQYRTFEPIQSQSETFESSQSQQKSIQAQHKTSESTQHEHVTSEPIQYEHIIPNPIEYQHVTSNAIQSQHVTSGYIKSHHVTSESIQSQHMISESIQLEHVALHSIQSEHVTFRFLQSNPVTMDSNLSLTVNSGVLQSEQVTLLSNESVHGTSGSADTTQSETTWWHNLLDYTQLLLVVTGFFTNLATVVTLFQNGKAFSPAIRILLRHQSALDALACSFSGLLLVQPSLWLFGNHVLDLVVCNAWHSQGLYWTTLLASIWNLVAIAFERFLAVCFPFKHQDFTQKRGYMVMGGIYVFCALVHWPNYTQTHLVDGVCKMEFLFQTELWQRVIFWYSISVFFTFYSLPCTLFVVLYGLVIRTFYQRRHQTNLAASRVIDKASAQLTKTAIIVTVIFITSMGYSIWYFLLGTARVVSYTPNSIVQKMGVWLSSLNSVANPFVYALLMPVYRSSVRKVFCRCCTASPGGSHCSMPSTSR